MGAKGWLVISLAVAVAAPLAAAPSHGSSPTQVVRLPAEAAADLDRLALRPVLDLDYGSFRWLELGQAEHGRLVKSGTPWVAVVDAGVIRVQGFRFDPLRDGALGLSAPGRTAAGDGLRLVQLVAPLRDEWLTELEGLGITLLQYYPHHTYLVWVSSERAAAAGGLPFVRWQGPFAAEYRVAPSLAEARGRIENLAVTFYDDGEVDGTLARVRALGGTYLQHFPAQPDGRFMTAIFTLDAGRLGEAALIDTVWALEYVSPSPGFDDEISAQIVAGNYAGTLETPYPGYLSWLFSVGVDGTGITWAVIDTGLRGTHPDIAGRTPVYVAYPGAPAANTDPHGHGSHTAGAVFGDPRPANGGTGITDPDGFLWGLGTAPGAGMVIQNAIMGSSWPPSGGWQVLSKDSLISGAIGSSNSWYTGASGAQGYSSAARTHDLMVRDGNFDTSAVAEPIIMVFSAGNSGSSPSTITEPKEAKNLIVVGASYNYRTGPIANMASFSSRGPALDGRLLPNVIAPGVRTASWYGQGPWGCTDTVSGPGAPYYSYCDGTSMACPLVAGLGALIADWWSQEGWGRPSPAMVKALLINGAVDMVGGSGVNGNIPNNNQGWGRADISKVIRNGHQNVYQDQITLFAHTGDSHEFGVTIPNPGSPLKVTLVWSDAAGAIGASPALVNNLDLTVTTGGSTYLGNVFSGGWSTTGGTADTLNNIENVFLQSPAESAVITVTATAINGDGVPYNGDATDQDFALVCTNCIDQTQYTLTVTKTGTGFGTVTSSPGGIACGSDCDEPYTAGTVVVLDPVPDVGSCFTGWSGHPDCNDGRVRMYGDRTCTAEFTFGCLFFDDFESGNTSAWPVTLP